MRPGTPPPACWRVFWDWLGLPAPLHKRLWSVVATSQAEAVRGWYHALLYYQWQPADPSYNRAFLHGPLGPHQVTHVLEALVATGELSRQDANSIEDCILTWANALGRWS